jgi:hypothetical protein
MTACLALAGTAAAQSTLALDNQTSILRTIGSTVSVSVTGPVGSPVALMLDTSPGPTPVPALGITVPLGLTPAFFINVIGTVPASGTLTYDVVIPWREQFHGTHLWFAALVADLTAPNGFVVSNGADLKIAARPQLAGNPLAAYPFFEHVAAINRGSPVSLGLDPRFTSVAGQTVDIYVVAKKTIAQWIATPALVDVRGAPQTVTFPAGATTIQQNTFLLDNGALLGPNENPSSQDARIGVGYDVVIDVGRDGQFDDGVDLIDGYSDTDAGFYVVRDLARGGTVSATAQGPYAVTSIIYSGGTFLGEETYYPSNIASLGQLPLVVVSHGNGHDYTWYDHIGYHLASYGYVVMSHQNNTMPGSHTAALTTISNTEYLLSHLNTIGGGALLGHVDANTIVWLGHSRGGDGVARAYDLLFRGVYIPVNFTISSIKLITSMAPVDFGGWDGSGAASGAPGNGSHPHDANFHVWVAQADSDVNGCASTPETFWYNLYERATRKKQSISIYGAGHGDLHSNFSASEFASGPNLIGRQNTHQIMRGYLLALVSHHIKGDVPSRDFLWRQYESFHAVTAPPLTTLGVTVNMTLHDDIQSGAYVIDNFQNQSTTSPNVGTSGASVSFTVQNFVEGRADDANADFTANVNDPFNGFTYDEMSGTGANHSNAWACTFAWNGGSSSLTYDLSTAFSRPNFRDYGYLSFRAAQMSRDPLTVAVLGDLTFSVALEDATGVQSTINLGSYGGGIEEPYQRNTDPVCGVGLGWNSEYETIRIRLTDFLNNGSNLDLAAIRRVVFKFGPAFGSTEGRIGMDDIELTRN